MRIAEALSKMRLQPFATEADVEEALRLFQVSTLDAALSGTLSGEWRGCGLGAPRAGRRAEGSGVAVFLPLLPGSYSPGLFPPDEKSRFSPDP